MRLSLVCECNLSRPDVKLRQFQIESINFVSTQVADEESRAVGGNIAPMQTLWTRLEPAHYEINRSLPGCWSMD